MSRKLDEVQRRAAKSAVLSRIEAGPWPVTYSQLSGVAFKATEAQWPELAGRTTDADRMADQVIQKERRAGRIVQVGRGQWWPTDRAEK